MKKKEMLFITFSFLLLSFSSSSLYKVIYSNPKFTYNINNISKNSVELNETKPFKISTMGSLIDCVSTFEYEKKVYSYNFLDSFIDNFYKEFSYSDFNLPSLSHLIEDLTSDYDELSIYKNLKFEDSTTTVSTIYVDGEKNKFGYYQPVYSTNSYNKYVFDISINFKNENKDFKFIYIVPLNVFHELKYFETSDKFNTFLSNLGDNL